MIYVMSNRAYLNLYSRPNWGLQLPPEALLRTYDTYTVRIQKDSDPASQVSIRVPADHFEDNPEWAIKEVVSKLLDIPNSPVPKKTLVLEPNQEYKISINGHEMDAIVTNVSLDHSFSAYGGSGLNVSTSFMSIGPV